MFDPKLFVRIATVTATVMGCSAWSGCAPAESDADEELGEEAIASALGGTSTRSFQAGVLPSAAYAGATDATIREAASATNEGASPSLLVDDDHPSASRKAVAALLAFDVRSIPADSVVQSVTLTLNVTNATQGVTYAARRLTRAWSESQVTWQEADAVTAWDEPGATGATDRTSASVGALRPAASGKYTFALNAGGIGAVQAWVKNPASNHGLSIVAGGSADGFGFDSSEATIASNRPKLTVTYAPSPISACDAAKRERAALVPGAYRPSAATTGPLSCVPLRRVDGDYVVTAAGTVVEGLDIHGSIVLGKSATNVTVRNCVVRGRGSSVGSAFSAIVGESGALDRRGLVVEDTLIDFTGRENWFADGLQGSNLTVRRTEIVRTTDGIGLVDSVGNVLVESSWIHDGAHATWTDATPQPKPKHSDNQTHNDGVQFHRGKNITLRGNFIGGVRGATSGTGDDYNNACLMISQGVDSTYANKLENVLIERNWFEGGAARVNLYMSNGNDLSSVTLRNNRFLRDDRGYYILRGAGIRARLENNVHDDTGAAVTIVNGR